MKHQSLPVTTLTVFSFPSGKYFRAFSQMAFARRHLLNVPGLKFHKLMGTGQGIGFTREPDWSRYAFLGTWEDEQSARGFHSSSRFMERYQRIASRSSTLYLHTLQSHGRWDKEEPFIPVEKSGKLEGEIGILTRATIKPAKLKAFWSMVEPVSNDLKEATGLKASIGIGELPFIRQATFSIWESAEEMKEFAYKSFYHREVIRRTREEGWYNEDLFARFAIVDKVGNFP